MEEAGILNDIKNEMEELIYQNELEVVLSLLPDDALLKMVEQVKEMIRGEVYRQERFLLSCGQLRGVIATIMFAFWVRRGKGIKVEGGEIVVCELKESPYWEKYEQPTLSFTHVPTIARDDTPLSTEKETEEEVRGEWV